MPCDEGLVRRLLGPTAQASALPAVLRAYEKEAGAPMIPPALAPQIEQFSKENAALEIGCDTFLDLVKSLDTHESDSDVENVLDNSLVQDLSSPDTTWEFEAPETPVKHSSPFALRTAGVTRSALSERDVRAAGGDERRSALIRKLAHVNDALERLQAEHDEVVTQKEKQDHVVHTLERQCASLQRDLREAQAQEQVHNAKATELEQHAKDLREKHHAETKKARRAQADLERNVALASALEGEAKAHEDEVVRLQKQCVSYAADTNALHETCEAQRAAIAGLEEAVDTLEQAHVAAERLRVEYDTFQAMHAELENELASLKTGRCESPMVLAMELASIGRRARAQSAPPLPKGWEREPGEVALGGSGAEAPSEPADDHAPEAGAAQANEHAGTVLEHADKVSEQADIVHEQVDKVHDQLHKASDQVQKASDQAKANDHALELAPSNEPHDAPTPNAHNSVLSLTSQAPLFSASTSVPFSAQHESLPAFGARSKWPSPLPAHSFAYGLFLVVGIWLGMWMYSLALRRASPLHACWAEANLLHDPLALPGTPGGEASLWFDLYRSAL